MNVEDKYKKLRAAALEMVGIGDNLNELHSMRRVLLPYSSAQEGDENAIACIVILDALIETHDGSGQ